MNSFWVLEGTGKVVAYKGVDLTIVFNIDQAVRYGRRSLAEDFLKNNPSFHEFSPVQYELRRVGN
jgi:hypothetical protein